MASGGPLIASAHAPAISVLLPVRNGAATLEAAAGSILAQTEKSWELLIIENGSSDATPELMGKIAERDSRVRLFTMAHAGLVPALQLGSAHARGRYLARMDADDWSHPERLSEQKKLLDQNPDLGLAACQVEFGGDRSSNRGYATYVDWINSLLTPEEISIHRFVESPLAHPSVLFRKELLQKHGGWRDGDYPEDYDLWLRWLEAGVRMSKVPRMLLRWNDPQDRLSRSQGRYSVDAFYRCKSPYLARWIEQNLEDRPLWIWGAGRITRERARLLEDHGASISAWIDVDPAKIGQSLDGLPVISFEDLPQPAHALIVCLVANRGAREEVSAHLLARGYIPGRDFVLAA